ncbi:MAG: phosphoribosylamine--glycine ligase [Firmicutes bacterium]|nr:phosphoribosylamine--glycine ligase [Bacillota bacterium]
MKILVVGSGGREHAIVWKLAQSPKAAQIYCAPGNAGIASLAACVPIKATDVKALADWAEENKIDLTVIGMDDPLMLGIVDEFESRGLRVFGPRANAAIIEGSKVFSKNLMKKYGIPTAAYEEFTSPDEAKAYIQANKTYPLVLKADGLALGKGVLICENQQDALDGVDEIMVDKKFGQAGSKMVIEEFLRGQEVSVLSFCDGKTVKTMVSAQDHKRAFDGDQGLNTGGMGTFSPSQYYTKDYEEKAIAQIFQKTVDAMNQEGRTFKGVLYFGLMLTENGPKVLEYNARFGDPETQVILPRLKTDLVDIFEACIDGTLDQLEIEWEDNAAVCVVLASGGYPVSYQKGYPIEGLNAFEGQDDLMIFHAGTAFENTADGKQQIVTSGGRVLGIVALAKDLPAAIEKAYQNVDKVTFKDAFYRHDIGRK